MAKLSICVLRSITFEGIQQFLSNFTEGLSIIKYMASSNLEVNCKLLTELWPFFDLGLGYNAKAILAFLGNKLHISQKL